MVPVLQDNWKTHKAACSAVRTGRPYLVHFDYKRETTDDAPWCKPLIDSLAIPYAKSFYTADSIEAMFEVLEHPIRPAAILCTTGEVAKRSNRQLIAKIRSYVSDGGRFVFGGPGVSAISMPLIDELFAGLGLAEWKVAQYHRTTHALNVAHPLFHALPADAPARFALPASYSTKAITLSVPTRDGLFRTDSNSKVESIAMMFGGGQISLGEAAVACTKVGDCWLSWVGDVNQEAGSTQAMLFLLGLKG